MSGSIDSHSAGQEVAVPNGRRVSKPGDAKKKRFVLTRHTRRQFLAQFFGLSLSTAEAARRTGHPLPDGEEQIRRLGQREWRKLAGVE